ncbi:hypothetical protein ACWEPL_29950 [Nonomuraea sp. NPDC004186]
MLRLSAPVVGAPRALPALAEEQREARCDEQRYSGGGMGDREHLQALVAS